MVNTSSIGELVTSSGTFPVLGSGASRWVFTAGVQPSIGVYDVMPTSMDSLLKSDPKQPVSLRLFSNTSGIEIKQLWIDGMAPGPNQFIKQVRLSDRRRFLARAVVIGRYNIKREIGVRRVLNHANPLLQDVIPTVWYAAYSLKNPAQFPADLENKWKPLEMLKDVFRKAVKIEERYTTKAVPDLIIREEISKQETSMAVEDLTVDGNGDYAMDQALRSLPEAALTIDKDGNYVVFSRVSGKEEAMIKKLGPEIANAGHVEFISNAFTAPSEIEILWPVEAEVRFDYIEPFDGTTRDAIVDQRELINVIPVPDWALSDSVSGLIAQGTFRELQTILSLWGTPPGIGGRSLTLTTLRKAIPGYIDLYAAFELTGKTAPRADWASRLAALGAHFRLTYQLPPRWVDRWLSFRPYRVGIADPVTQTRAKSEAYCDFYRMMTLRSFFKNKAEGASLEYAVNTPGYPTGGAVPWNVPGAKKFNDVTKAAPAAVSVINPDLGIIHLEFRPDMFRVYEVTGPGKVVLSDGSAKAGPVADFASANDFPVGFDLVHDKGQVPILESPFKMAVIVTAVPASPNDNRQFYKIKVKPADVESMFPPAARGWLKAVKGPVWQSRISAGMEGGRAMVRWLDDSYQEIEKLFGITEGEPNIDNLVVNRNSTVLTGGLKAPNLDIISRAIAARIWARFADRWQGAMAAYVNAGVELDGWITSLVHQVDTRGEVTTGLTLPESLPLLPFENLLDSATRAILAREGQPLK